MRTVAGAVLEPQHIQVLQDSSESPSANSGPRALASSRKLSSTFVAKFGADVAQSCLKLGLSLAEHRLA